MTNLTPELQTAGRFSGMMDNLGLMARASLVGMGGLALAVEGGAAIGHDIPGIVIEAVAGTGIPVANITPKCPPNSTAGVKVVVTEVGKSYTFTFKDLTDGHTGSQNVPFGESGGFNAAIGHKVLTTYSGGPETDTQTVDCAADTTTVPPTTVPPTTMPPTTAPPTTASPTTVRQTTTAPPTTASPNTTSPGATVPRGEAGNTATTNTTSGSVELSPQTPITETTDVSSLTVPPTSAAGKAESGSLARTGSDSELPLGIAGAALLGIGGMFVALARRRRRAEQATQ